MVLDDSQPELNIEWDHTNPHRTKDRATGNNIFQLSGRYSNPIDVQWDGHHLVAGYWSGEVVALGFNCMLPYGRYLVCWPHHTCKGWYS